MRALATSLVACFALFAGFVMVTAYQHGNRSPAPIPQARESHGPDISHCFSEEEERELWDCIRHEEE